MIAASSPQRSAAATGACPARTSPHTGNVGSPLSGRVRPAAQTTQQRSPLSLAQPAGRGTLQVAHAATGFGGAFVHEFEMYRAEHDFHSRTLQIMREITKTFKQEINEWKTYRAEFQWWQTGARPAAAAHTGASALAKVFQAAAAASNFEAEVEDDGFRPGGYHPVQAGETFNNGRYTALHFLGMGHYATVWMVRDEQTGQELAMKVVKSAENYTWAAQNEVEMLQRVSELDPEDANHCVRLLDTFEHDGPHGRHVCEVFEAMGDDLLTLIRLYSHRGIPLPVVRHLARQTLVALNYLHTKCNIVHLDIKPENVMLAEPVRPRGAAASQRTEVDLDELEPRLLNMGCKVVDFGCAHWLDRLPEGEIQTRQYRAPEVILAAPFGDAADIWSLACMLYELVTGDFLFEPKANEQYDKDDDHLAQVLQLSEEQVPLDLLEVSQFGDEFFTTDGRLRNVGRVRHRPLHRLLQEKGLPAEEAKELADFLMPMLSFDPRDRASAGEMLQHPWLQQESQLERQQRRQEERIAEQSSTLMATRVRWGSPRRSQTPSPHKPAGQS